MMGFLSVVGSVLYFWNVFPVTAFRSERREEAVGYCGHHFSIVGIVEDDGLVGSCGSCNGKTAIDGSGHDL